MKSGSLEPKNSDRACAELSLLVVLATTLATPPWLRRLVARSRRRVRAHDHLEAEPPGGWLCADDGQVELRIPPGTQQGKTFRLRGKGIPHLRSSQRGSMHVVARVVVPGKLTARQRELFEQLAQELDDETPDHKGFFDKVEEIWGMDIGVCTTAPTDDEARSFATLIQQSAELGSSISDALRVYSDDMRHKRLSRAEEKAYSLPAKLAVPMMVCIFPVIFVVILLPMAVRLYTGHY